MPRDFYAILALPRNASEEQIRQRFRELARERHPDRFQGEAKARAEGEFQEITQAFNVLFDPERRRGHDLELTRPEPGSTGADPPLGVGGELGVAGEGVQDRRLLDDRVLAQEEELLEVGDEAGG